MINDAVVLNWSTATEVNNQMFEIERRSEEGQFITIGYVEGYGTTTEPQEYSYMDNSVGTGIYYYKLKQIDYDGSFEYSDIVEVEVTAPMEFALRQNYPNPFNPSATINYQIPELSNVTLKVYDVLGNVIETLVNEEKQSGIYNVEFDATGLSSGIYLYRLQAGNFIETKKMLLLK